jgi:spore maturation protein CgeB
VEALRELGAEVASFNSDDRIQFYGHALISTGDVDETGHPLVRRAMNDADALRMAMQGVSHAAFSMWPDAVLFVSGFFVTPGLMALLQSRRMKVILLGTESPYQEQMQLDRAQCSDITLLNDPSNIEQYRKLGIVAEYAPHAYRPSVHYPRQGPPDKDLNADLAFIGTGFASRIEFFEKMDLDGLDVLLGGCWPLAAKSPLRQYMGHDIEECVPNYETAEVYRNAKCGINFYRREYDDADDAATAAPWAMGPREVEQAACQMPFLRDPRAEGNEVLHMLPTFATPEDAGEQLRWLLSHETEREKIARQAREAIQDRTFTNNAKRLLKLLDD